MQENRFELKYVIEEWRAHAVRDFARSYLVPDPHANPVNFSYAIHSLYLDNVGLALFRSTVCGQKNRFKLRIRYYDNNPANPVFFEIKRRVNDAILKRRGAVRRDAVAALLNGHWPTRYDLADPEDGRGLDNLSHFCDLRDRINAVPQCIVSYVREAWVTPDSEAVRVTFDRKLTASPWRGEFVTDVFETGLHPPVDGVVLEIKFTDRFPNWIRDMVQALNLRRMSMAKYVQCMYELKRPRPISQRVLLEGRL